MLKTASSSVLGRTAPCDVPQGYASVALLPAALLDGRFEHPSQGGCWKHPPASFSAHQNPQRTPEGTPQSPHSLWPRWMTVWSIR